MADREARPPVTPRLGLLPVLGLVGACWLLTVTRYAGPEPLGLAAPGGVFSAGRAMGFLAGLVGDGSPRPLGSAAGVRARDWLVAELARLGYQPRVEGAFVCGEHGTCGRVENVVAVREGRDRQVVLLMAHRDSAVVSPGTADDGYGVAALLEIARALAAEPPGRYPVAFLFTDGEESGLLGAQAFVDTSPLLGRVGLAINLDGRGTRGPSVLYETSPGNAWLMDRAAALDQRPVVSSLAQAIYRKMPVDTDLSVLLAAGVQGVNFAYVGDIFGYHTPLDRLDRAEPRTLQHHGDHALALLRAVQAQGLEPPSAVDAVAFDLLGYVLVMVSPRTLRVLALLALAVLGLAVLRMHRLGVAGFEETCRGFLLALGALATAVLLAALGGLAVPSWFVAPSAARSLAGPAAGVAGLLAACRWAVPGRAGPWAIWGGTWLLWSLIGLGVAALLPGASYLFVLPALAAAVAGGGALLAARHGTRTAMDLAFALPVLVAIPLWVPVVWLGDQALGFAFLAAVPAVMALGLTSLLPLAAAWCPEHPRGSLAGAILLGLAAVLLPRVGPFFDEAHPMRFNLDLHCDADRSGSRWLASAFFGPLPPRIRAIDLFGTEPILPFPWSRRFHQAWQGPALWDAPPGPALLPLGPPPAGAGRVVEARLKSFRPARQVGLLLPPATRLGRVTMDDAVVRPSHPKGYEVGEAWQSLAVVAPGPDGAVVRIEILEAEPVQAWLYDQAPVPDSDHYRELDGKRGAWTRQSHTGDTSWITRRLEL